MTANDFSVRALAQFFDDIRMEVSGKLILIGQYVNELIMHPEAQMPVDRLSVLVTMRWPRDHNPKEISIKALLSGQPPIVQVLPPPPKMDLNGKPISPFSGVTAQMVINCRFLPLRGGDVFDVWVILDGVEVPAGRLEVVLADKTSPATLQPAMT